MAAVRKSDRGILRAEQFRAFQLWLIDQRHSVQEEGELIFWCSAEPKGAPNSSVSVGIDDICVTSYDLRETVRRFQDSMAKRRDREPEPMPSNLSEYEQDLRDDFAISALGGIMANDYALARFSRSGEKEGIDPNVLASTAAYVMADAMLEARKK